MRPNASWIVIVALVLALVVAGPAAAQTWPTYADETATRLVVDPAYGTADAEEKDYAWGDVDKDGDVDLVCVRKEPWNTTGLRRNVLLMNEGTAEGHAIEGVLVDRSLELASSADDGGQGMLDLTNDRDVALVDVDGDTWLDVVTATTYGEGLPKSISHPRVYMNLGEIGGVWQGFRYEQARTPAMPVDPHFCGVGVGDVDDDAAPDLYFVDYNNTLEDRLWINDGSGVFGDESLSRLTAEMRESDFGVHAVIADLNGDGAADIVKDRGSTLTVPPLRISISWNDPADEGTFDSFEVLYDGNPYHVEVGELNGDGLLDIVIDDDGFDRYFLNQGNDPGDGLADFLQFQFPAASDSFGGNIVIEDVNRDGHNDVLIADVDVDCCGCTRHMHFWRNNGDTPNVTFAEESGGVPIAARTGTHDVAVFDINGDEWPDMVIGTCTGTSVWIAQPQLAISYPQGLPSGVIGVGAGVTFQVAVESIAGATADPATATVHASVNGGPFVPQPMASIGTELFEATLPPTVCGDRVAFYTSIDDDSGVPYLDPPGAPGAAHEVIAAFDLEISLLDEIEGDVSAWTITSDPSIIFGAWEQADPEGTLANGEAAAPEDDATADPGMLAFVTENGAPGGAVGAADLDGGPTRLVSPPFDVAGEEAIVTYERWFFTTFGVPDALTVEISNDGGANWVTVTDQTTSGTGSLWETASFTVGDWVTPTADMRVRFTADDTPNDSITEAGIDDFRVERLICAPPCQADVDGDGTVGVVDLLSLLSAWGPCPGCPEDFDGSGAVEITDLLLLLGAWGACGG